MNDNTKEELADLLSLLRQHGEVIKPNFGFMFWELLELEKRLSPADFAEQGMNFRLESDGDEIIASFIAGYIKLWYSADDFYAASRFIANALGMSADELIQTRVLYLKT